MVIDPVVKVLEPPMREVESTVEAMATHCVPFQPKIESEDNDVIALLASQVRVIFAEVVPLISQYSTLFTDPTPVPIRDVLYGPPVGKIGSFPPLNLDVIAVAALTP